MVLWRFQLRHLDRSRRAVAAAISPTSIDVHHAIDLESAIQKLDRGTRMESDELAALIRQCGIQGALQEGRKIHEHLVSRGFQGERYLENLLVEMYGKCGSVDEAVESFSRIAVPNEYSWTILITVFATNGYVDEAFICFAKMALCGVRANAITFVVAINACAMEEDHRRGKALHEFLVPCGFFHSTLVGNALIHMYGKCRDLNAARRVFDEVKRKDVVTWNSMISAYAQNGRGKEALEVYDSMDRMPDKITYVGAIEACASLQNLEQGRMIHARIDKGGVKPDAVLENSILSMYWKCRSLDDVKAMFGTMESPSFVAWNIMILAYAHCGRVKEALGTFQRMDMEGVEADVVSFSSALDACAHAKALDFGKAIHDSLGTSESRAVCVNNALTNFYGRCGCPEEARKIFDQMPTRDVISWTAMISVYVETGFSAEALALYREMCLEGGKPNQVTLKIALDACAELGALSAGKVLHSCVPWSEETAPQVGNTLINFYSRCGQVGLARAAFDKLRERDLASWTTMFRAYDNHGNDREVIQLFYEMVDKELPDAVVFSIALQSCATSKSLSDGKAIHRVLADSSDDVKSDLVVCNTLMSMYAKCGCSPDAREVFESMSRRNVITWNGIMKAYALQGDFEEALAMFKRLEAENEVKPDRVTFVVAIDCCACKPCLEEGRRIHASVIASGLDLDLIIGNTLVNMYGKCGQVETARSLFDRMVIRDVVTWTSLLASYASNGHGQEGLELFWMMQQDYQEPNEVTFLGVLFACSHLGLVTDSKRYLFSMQQDYGLTPGQEHFSCVIDLLARSGRLDEAEELVCGLPFQPDNVIVTSLLGACTTQGDMKRGIRAAELVFGLDGSDQVPYVLLWNIYAAAGHWQGVERVEKALGWT